MFKKYPNAEILPLPIIKKNDHLKASKASNIQSETANLAAFQTLFRDQLGITDSKQKTAISMAESGIEKLYTMKTEVFHLLSLVCWQRHPSHAIVVETSKIGLTADR